MPVTQNRFFKIFTPEIILVLIIHLDQLSMLKSELSSQIKQLILICIS